MIKVESYHNSGSGLHGDVHMRPLPGQKPFETWMHVECSKEMVDTSLYKVGTKFLIRAKIANREGGSPFVYSHYKWPFKKIEEHG